MNNPFTYFICALLLLGCINIASACGCVQIGNPSPQEAIKTTDLVFSGKVVHIDTVETAINELVGFTKKEIFYTFSIQEVIKGKKRLKQLRIKSGQIDADDCKYIFSLNESYIVFANYSSKSKKRQRSAKTNICTETQEFTEAMMKSLRKG